MTYIVIMSETDVKRTQSRCEMSVKQMQNGYGMGGKINGLRVHNLIPRPDAWAWKTKRVLESPNPDNFRSVEGTIAGRIWCWANL